MSQEPHQAAPAADTPPGTRSSLAVLAFVALCLAALAATPVLMIRQLDAMRDDTQARVGPIRDSIFRSAPLFSDVVVAHQSVRIGEPGALERYRDVSARERRAVAALVELARPVSPDALRHARELQRWNDEWLRLADGRAEGRMTEEEFTAGFGRVAVARDSVGARLGALGTEVQRVDARFQAAGGRIVRAQRRISTWLGALGIVALAALGWAAHRERELTRALRRSLAQEARLRGEAERSRADLQAVSESKARLMRGFGHDVKNPLGAADGYLQLLADGVYGEVGERQRHSVERARASVDSALDLIEDLLEIARGETGNILINRAPTDLRRVIGAVVDDYRQQAEAKGLDLSVRLPGALPALESDPVRVRQVLGNLVSNAVKYTPSGWVRVQAEPRAGDGGRAGIAVEVIDTGLGIPEEKRHLLFQEFVRFEPGVAKGTGIGLAFSARLAEALGGTISLHPEPAGGSRFTLWLPAEPPPTEASHTEMTA